MRVTVIVAHPDDEVLGCGGALDRHARMGDLAQIIFMGYMTGGGISKERWEETKKAMFCLGYDKDEKIHYGKKPAKDQMLDEFPIVYLIENIEETIKEYQPDVIYTHSQHDLNRDHRLVYEAVRVAARPSSLPSLRALYCMEIPSTTELGDTAFRPDYFVPIDIDKKIEAMQCYKGEMMGARSEKVLRAWATVRGGMAGVDNAEAFVTRWRREE